MFSTDSGIIDKDVAKILKTTNETKGFGFDLLSVKKVSFLNNLETK